MQQGFALLFILILSPLLVLVLLLVWIADRQSPTFIQERIGFRKERFYIYKIRTMRDGKITLLGKILRKTGVDELPQLFNIAMGEMNFVGPRPLTIQDIQRLGWDHPKRDVRWSVKPGITGFAQLTNVCSADVSWENDIKYIKEKNRWTDVKIIFRSFLVPIIGKRTQ